MENETEQMPIDYEELWGVPPVQDESNQAKSLCQIRRCECPCWDTECQVDKCILDVNNNE